MTGSFSRGFQDSSPGFKSGFLRVTRATTMKETLSSTKCNIRFTSIKRRGSPTRMSTKVPCRGPRVPSSNTVRGTTVPSSNIVPGTPVPACKRVPNRPRCTNRRVVGRFCRRTRTTKDAVCRNDKRVPNCNSTPTTSAPPGAKRVLRKTLRGLSASLPMRRLVGRVGCRVTIKAIVPKGKGCNKGAVKRITIRDPSAVR